jgi:hypothetical protein
MSAALAAGLAVEGSDEAALPVLGVALVGTLATAAALVWPIALGPALATSAGAYALLLAIDEPRLDSRAVAVSVALLVTGELVGWARELRSTTRDEPGNAWRRPIWIAGLAFAALGLSWTVLAAVDLARVEGLAVETVGALAALGALVLVLRLSPRETD